MDRYSISNLIDIDSPQLKFQDFPEQVPSGSSKTEIHLPNETIEDETTLQTDNNSIWSLLYYQKFFDVDTDVVVNRIKWSMIPRRLNYLQHFIHTKPDLYGPFWISVTLVFTIAISGNLSNYLQTAGSHEYHWKYEFHTVSSAATAIFCYAWLLPSLLWTYLRWSETDQDKMNLLELICLYGYCMSIYIPVSVLWVIQINWLQWFLVLLGAILSGAVLMTSMMPRFGNKKWPLVVILSVFHIVLAVSFMLYFFHVPSVSVDQAPFQETILTKTNSPINT